MNIVIFQATVIQLPAMLGWIRSNLSALPFSSSVVREIELAVEEALVNIIQHAYKQRPGAIELRLNVIPESCIEIGIKDWGPLFNPLLHKSFPDIAASIEQRREGGLGVFFLSAFVDDVLYESDGETNLLILVKRFSQKP